MAVRVDEVSSDVTVEPEVGSTASQADDQRSWDRLFQWRALRERAAADASRTRAEDFDD